MRKYMFGNQELVIPSVNMLGDGAKLNGDITISGDLRIDGKLIGNLQCTGKVTIGTTGYIEGNIVCKNADIAGEVKGNIFSTELVILKETSKFCGELKTLKLMVESGSILLANCVTGVENIE